MQTGGAMPFVTFGTSNVDDEGNTDISLTLTNNGVGPAILGPIEIRYQGKPIATPVDLLESCCGATDARGLSFATRSEERRVGKECVSTCRSGWSPYYSKKKTHTK